MSLRIPDSRDEIFNKLASDVQANLPETNPQRKQSWLRAILVGFAGAFYDLYFQILNAIDTFFADTTYGIYLERKAANYGITRNAATIATGNVVFSGTVGTSIPSGTSMTDASGTVYETTAAGTIVSEAMVVSLLTYSSGEATVTTSGDHDLGTGKEVVIAGATPSGLNGTVTVTSILTATSFTYEHTVVGSGTATGTITATKETAVIAVESADEGVDQNLSGDTKLTISTPIANIDNEVRVTYDEVSGGADEEDDESLKARLIYRLQNPVTLFNSAQITIEAEKLAFVDRVFVQETTPDVGEVTVYILKDQNDIPSASELAQVKAQIVDTILPANTSEADLFVSAPTPLTTNFQLTDIVPDTDTMKLSITNKLTQFFANETIVGSDVTENKYLSVIQTTVDTDSGELLTSFTLNSPTGDISVSSDEIALLGSVTYV